MKWLAVMFAVAVVAATGCTPGMPSGCPLDTNGDGALTEADFVGMTEEDINAHVAAGTANPLAYLPCVPLAQQALDQVPDELELLGM